MANNIGFKIVGVKTEQFAILEENFKEKGKITLNTDLEFKANSQNFIVAAFATFNFKSNNNTFLILEVCCEFAVAPDSWNDLFTDNKIEFPKDFMTHIAMITIGTSRGVLHAKTEGTKFNNFLLPTIDLRKIVTENVLFTFDENKKS